MSIEKDTLKQIIDFEKNLSIYENRENIKNSVMNMCPLLFQSVRTFVRLNEKVFPLMKNIFDEIILFEGNKELNQITNLCDDIYIIRWI